VGGFVRVVLERVPDPRRWPEALYLATLLLVAIQVGVTRGVPTELVYRMSDWNDAIGMVTKSLNESQWLLRQVGLDTIASTPDAIGSRFVGPARRLPFVVIFLFASPLFTDDYLASFQLAFRIGIVYAAIVAFLVTGIVVYLVLERLHSRRVGIFGLVAFCASQVINWPGLAYGHKYQFIQGAPIILAGLYLGDRVVGATGTERKDRLAVLTGVALGVGGLVQYHYTLLAILAVVVSFAVYSHWRQLVITGGVGSVFASLYLLVPQARERAINKPSQHFSSRSGGEPLVYTPDQVIAIATEPGVVLVLLAIGGFAGLYFVTDEPFSRSRIFELFLVFAAILWVVPKFTGVSDAPAIITLWMAWYVLVIAGVQQSLAFVDTRWPTLDLSLENARIQYGLVGGWVVLTVFLLTVGPIPM
jgi:hypothetical protein